jgi:alkanesulfonate monooxygenase SsuD/methylene tetrahydromethanopterin reductase-like flavin-dependent oxidoreductase (luciferase family)
MLGFNLIAADTDVEAEFLATSMLQAFINLRRGAPTALPPPKEGYAAELLPHERAGFEPILRCSAIGTAETVRRKLADFIAMTHADELILAAHIFDHAARVRSFEIAGGVRAELAAAQIPSPRPS